MATKCKDCGDTLGSNSFCHRCKFVESGGTEEVYERREYRRKVYSMGSDFWRCPATNRVLQGHDHDDKVLCGCGSTNPKLIAASPKSVEVHGGVTVHVKKYLTPATVDDFIEQKDREEAMRENANPTRKLYIIRVNDADVKRWVVFDDETVTVVHHCGTQRETIDKFLAKRPGPYKYVRYSGSMRLSEMAMTVGDFKQKRDEKDRAARAGAKNG